MDIQANRQTDIDIIGFKMFFSMKHSENYMNGNYYTRIHEKLKLYFPSYSLICWKSFVNPNIVNLHLDKLTFLLNVRRTYLFNIS